MMNRKSFAPLLLAAALVAGLLAGCAEGSRSAAPSPDPAKEGFHLAVCLAPSPQSMDPALNTSADGAIMLQHLFEGLMKWQDDGEGNAVLVPGQAAVWEKERQEDGTVIYTFRLRDDACWSDGKRVTADDFVYSWRRLSDPDTAAGYGYILDMVENGFEIMVGESEAEALGVSAPDEGTFAVRLTYDCPYFLELCAFPALLPVRRDVIEAEGDQWTFQPETYISNGIYKMDKWTQNDSLSVVPNEYHYDAANVGPDSITFHFSDDETAIYNGFKAGELAFIESVPVGEIPALSEAGVLRVADHIGTYFICFQNSRSPFDDARVRRALTLAVDSRYITSGLTRTGETPATGFVPYGVYDAQGAAGDDFRTTGGDYWPLPDTDELYKANCDKARALLADAGFPGGEGFPAVEYLYNTDARNRTIAEALQSMWAEELGITVRLVSQDWSAAMQSCFEGDYDMAASIWIADYNDPISFLDIWQTDGGNNIIRYSNPKFDAAVQKAKSTEGAAERMEAMHRAEDILIGEDTALAPVFFYTYYYCADPALEGLYYNPLGYFFFGYTHMG